MKSLAKQDPSLQGMYWVADAGACSGVYVVDEGRVLIDTGNMYGLLDELQEAALPDRLQAILLTHCHFDHVGGMAEIFQAVSPDVYLHRLTREYLRLLRAPYPDFFVNQKQPLTPLFQHPGKLAPAIGYKRTSQGRMRDEG